MQNEKNEISDQEKNPLDDFSSEQILANTVHEIRTPVQTIIGTLDLLSDTPLNDEQTEYIHQIRFGAEVLLTLVNDILDISKIKSGKMKLEIVPFNVKRLTDNVVKLISIEAFNKGLEIVTDIDYSIPDLVSGDPNRVQQILINILKNAVKFTETGYIHINLEKQENDFVKFSVTDTGIGVSESQRNKLFQNYYQVDPSFSRKYGGTGLGLSICKSLVTTMNGTIGVEANPFGGSIFWFSIPLPHLSASLSSKYQLPVPEDTRILIVDDSTLAIKSFENKLREIGLKNISSNLTGQDALLTLKYASQIDNPYKLVFIDMEMPVIDGWHLASEIKNNPALHDSKLYLLIPEGQMGQKAKMKVMDWFSGYLYKPVTLEKIDQLLLDSQQVTTTLFTPEKIKTSENSQSEDDFILKGHKILIAEDHPVNRKILCEFLKRLGVIVVEAENGEEAVKKINENKDINLIFMDIQMPQLNGIDATLILRKNGYDGIILACTANNDAEDFEGYKKAGMNDILIKPFKRENVREILEKWAPALNVPSEKEIQENTTVQVQTTPVNDCLWDSDDFEDTIGKNKDFGIHIVNDFIEQTKQLISDAAKSIKTSDFETLHRIAHTIKGSSAAISANRLYLLGDKISTASKASDTKDAKVQLDSFKKQFQLFILQAEKWKSE